MSYTQVDCALDVCSIAAAADIDAMDPDEIEAFARTVVADARCVRDDFDENGYEKGTNSDQYWECAQASTEVCTEDDWYRTPSGFACPYHADQKGNDNA